MQWSGFEFYTNPKIKNTAISSKKMINNAKDKSYYAFTTLFFQDGEHGTTLTQSKKLKKIQR